MVIISINKDKNAMSLIGLLIGMALGAVILAGMLQVFSGMRRSAALIKNEIELNESLLFAVQNMTKIIAQAGHIKPSATHTMPLLYTFTANNNVSTYPSWYLFTQTTTADGNDLSVRFTDDAAANIVHCNGQTLLPQSNTWRYSRYYLSGTFPYDLACDIVDVAAFGSLTPTTITLVKGMIAKLFFRFGEDANLDGAVDQYVAAPLSVTSYGRGRFNYASKTLRVGIIMRSAEPVFASNQPNSITLFKDMGSITLPTDQYLYRSAVFTVPLLDAPTDY